MSPIEWDTTLETGDELVDAQHKSIIALVNDVEALETDDVSAILGVVDRLMGHVEVHFSTEEDLMHRAGYPRESRDPHLLAHRVLKEKARSAALDFRGSWNLTRAPLVDFLRAWLYDHIETEDRELIAFVRRQEMSARLPE